MVKFILALFSSFFIYNAQAEQTTPTACELAKLSFEKRFSDLENKYRLISNFPLLEENKPYWHIGTKNEAVYLLHGYIGTPFDMKAAADKLTELGYTVVTDLIPGHGANGVIANQFGDADWREHVKANIDALRSCYPKVHLVGFSTGGLLIHDYLRNDPNYTAASVILYSPYYLPYSKFNQALNNFVQLFTNTLSTSFLYSLSHHPDAKIAILRPQNYLQDLPLITASRIAKLGKDVDSFGKISLNTHALLFVSDLDEIINLDATLKDVTADFSTLKVIHFTKKDAAPHHLMIPEVSAKAQDVLNETVSFIEGSGN